MKPRSLRVRLLLGAAIAIFIALAAAWVAMTLLFERHIERRVQAELVREGMQLAANLSVAPNGAPLLSREPGDARFVEPASGLYWQVTTPAGSLRSRSLWDQSLPASQVARARDWSARFTGGPFEEQLLLVERVVKPDREGPELQQHLRTARVRRCCCSSRQRTSRCTRRAASSERSWPSFWCCCGRSSRQPRGRRSRWD